MQIKSGHKTLTMRMLAELTFALLLASIINYYPVVLIANAQLVLGNVVAVIVTLVYGWRYGLAISFLASLVLWPVWGQLLLTLPFVLEIAVVGWAGSRNRPVVQMGMLYWVTLGWIIVALEYYFFTDLALSSQLAIVLKYILNGSINLLLGVGIVSFIPYFKNRTSRLKQPVSGYLRGLIFNTVTVTALIMMIVWMVSLQSDKHKEIDRLLHQRLEHIIHETDSYIENYRAALSLAATMEIQATKAEDWQSRMRSIHSDFPRILTMLITDPKGDIVASSPISLLSEIRGSNMQNVSDRPYFRAVKESGQPYISDVFVGRGFGQDPLVALSVPLKIEGEFVGVMEASLNLTELSLMDNRLLDPFEGVMILDRHDHVIYSSNHLGYAFVEDLNQSNLLAYLDNPDRYFVVDDKGNNIIARSSNASRLGWRYIVTYPRSVFEYSISIYAALSLILLIVSLALVYFMTGNLALGLVQPIHLLERALSKTVTRQDFLDFNLPESFTPVAEIENMQMKFNEFAMRLRDAISELTVANTAKEELNKQLNALNRGLEANILEKTQKLTLAVEQAEVANKAKSAFLAMMSHEIRTPLNGVLSMLALFDRSNLTEEQKKQIDIARESADTLLVLINDIIDFAKIEADKLELEEVDFNFLEMLQSVFNSFKVLAREKHISFDLNITGVTHEVICADPVRLRQVLNNLISNAVKFTEKGSVAVIVETVAQADHAVLLKVQVRDTGIGLTKTQQESLFESFKQADISTTRKFGGSGLGLAISKRICEMMDGEISVKSDKGQGSEFSFKVKVREGNPENMQDMAVVAGFVRQPGQSPQNVKILTVEDNLINQDVIEMVLAKFGYQTDMVNDGVEALDALRRQIYQPYDLILMDCNMPNMDGFEATNRIRSGEAGSLYKDVVIIALTANALKGDREKCLAAGMSDFLAKPIDITDMEVALSKWLDG